VQAFSGLPSILGTPWTFCGAPLGYDRSSVMPITADIIKDKLLAAFPEGEVAVRDTTGGGDHYAATIVSTAFEGQGLLDRHRMVYAALGDSMRSDIHALALTTLTPRERKP
jgi:stress-induced morphogen